MTFVIEGDLKVKADLQLGGGTMPDQNSTDR